MTEREKTLATKNDWRANHWLALVMSLGLTLGAGVLYGRYSQRWGPPADVLAAAKHLETLPHQIGPWQLTEELLMEESTADILECVGYLNRRYVHKNTGQVVSIAIIVGPPGPTAVHTPEICYSSRAYKQKSKREVIHFDDNPLENNSFWHVAFKPTNPLAGELKVYYAWSQGRNWEASISPRFKFAASPMLYKMQLAGTDEFQSKVKGEDICRSFLEDLLQAEWKLSAS